MKGGTETGGKGREGMLHFKGGKGVSFILRDSRDPERRGGKGGEGGIGDAWSKGKRSERGRAKRGRKLIRLTNYMCSNSVKETSCYGGIHKCV